MLRRLIIFALVILLTAALALQSVAQEGRVALASTQAKPAPTAAALYEEAANYSSKKFQEFAQKKLDFDQKLLQQTLKEQRELSARNAAQLAARPGLEGDDFFYLGMLYNLAENGEGAVDALKRYLGAKPSAAKRAQGARYLLAQLAAKLKLLDEAERALSDYTKNEPQSAGERSHMEDA
ncbi:MAG TPA: hypothetical protein VGO69_02470, partial [Pyrinomonadaceae bacterium]|nr:hypothetical protein [Pyrinomonadaceae bacterium]